MSLSGTGYPVVGQVELSVVVMVSVNEVVGSVAFLLTVRIDLKINIVLLHNLVVFTAFITIVLMVDFSKSRIRKHFNYLK